MRWLTEDALLKCDHGGMVKLITTQNFVRINHRRVLVDNNPEQRAIAGCPNVNPFAGIKPCQTTLKAVAGYSGFIRIGHRAICLDNIKGLTDGTPPGAIHYTVGASGQNLVEAAQ